MRPNLHHLRYFADDAWEEWRHSPGVNLLGLLTLTSVLFLASLFLMAMSNVESRVERMRGDIKVMVFLVDDVDEEQRGRLERRLSLMNGVARLQYVDKEMALRRFRAWTSQAELIDELETNPLPASFDLFLDPEAGADVRAESIADELRDTPGVEAVRYDQDLLARMESLLDNARFGGTVLALVVLTAVTFVIACVLRLAVYARRDEIDVMMLVGATPGFVRGPFLVAGVAHGIIAAVLALISVEVVRRLILASVGADATSLLGMISAGPISLGYATLIILGGLLVSLAGAFVAVKIN